MTSITTRSLESAASTSTTASNRSTVSHWSTSALHRRGEIAGPGRTPSLRSSPMVSIDTTKRFDERLERCRVVGKTATVEHQCAPVMGCSGRFGGQPALAGPGWPADEDDLPVTSDGIVPCRLDGAPLTHARPTSSGIVLASTDAGRSVVENVRHPANVPRAPHRSP